jgi:bifunctional non-homologous end joining protein LigD
MAAPATRTPWRDLALALPGARNRPVAAGFPPQLLRLVKQAPAGNEWLCETKWDGFRLLADLDGGKVRLRSRNDLDWTGRLPQIARAIESLAVRSARLDGELVALDRDGNSDFDALEAALEAGNPAVLKYAIYDLIALEQVDLSRVPLIERKTLLARLLEHADHCLIYSAHVVGHAPEAYAAAVRRQLEGIVCKRVQSPYSFTRSGDWIKVKRAITDEFLVVGYTAPQGARTGFGSLLLAGVQDGQLRYVGRVGAGFDTEHLRKLRTQLASLRRATAPVSLPPHVRLRAAAVTWVMPRVVVEVAYRGIAKLGLLRQASFLRLRIDKSAEDLGFRGGRTP